MRTFVSFTCYNATEIIMYYHKSFPNPRGYIYILIAKYCYYKSPKGAGILSKYIFQKFFFAKYTCIWMDSYSILVR